MNEKSKAYELVEFVWNNEKTDSYLRVNICLLYTSDAADE